MISMRIGALLALLFISLAPVLAVDVDKCMDITQPGYYRLVNGHFRAFKR
ncbi:MAG: hypothetical protein QW532_04345 [Archaeoglobaceae archaeon]